MSDQIEIHLRKVADIIQERKHAAQNATAKSAYDGDFDLESYWRARSEGLQQAEMIVRTHLRNYIDRR